LTILRVLCKEFPCVAANQNVNMFQAEKQDECIDFSPEWIKKMALRSQLRQIEADRINEEAKLLIFAKECEEEKRKMIRCGKGYLYTGKDPWNYWDRIDKKNLVSYKSQMYLYLKNLIYILLLFELFYAFYRKMNCAYNNSVNLVSNWDELTITFILFIMGQKVHN